MTIFRSKFSILCFLLQTSSPLFGVLILPFGPSIAGRWTEPPRSFPIHSWSSIPNRYFTCVLCLFECEIFGVFLDPFVRSQKVSVGPSVDRSLGLLGRIWRVCHDSWSFLRGITIRKDRWTASRAKKAARLSLETSLVFTVGGPQ